MSSSAPTITTHPWNTDFVWTDHQGPFRRLTESQAADFDRDGYVVLDEVFSADELAPVIDELDRLESMTEAFLSSQDDGRLMIAESGAITFTIHAVTHAEAPRAFSAHPVFADLCHDLVGPDARLYWDQAVYKKPEKPRRFPWHQDNGYTFVLPQQYLTCWVALTDATIENGCPQVIPGLHRMGTLTHHYVEPLGWEIFAEHPDAVAAPVGAGGIVVFSSLTPHLTGPNTTDDVRKAYILQYAPDGALIQDGDPTTGPPTGTRPTDADRRQYPIVSAGQALTPPPLT